MPPQRQPEKSGGNFPMDIGRKRLSIYRGIRQPGITPGSGPVIMASALRRIRAEVAAYGG